MKSSTVALEPKWFHYLAWFFLAALYAPIFIELYNSRWENIDYTHAYFILPVSLWAVWQGRTLLKSLLSKTGTTASNVIYMAAVILGLMMFVLGWRREYLFVSSLSLIPALWGAAGYLYGGAVLQALTFPIFYLLFLVPPPLGVLDAVTLPMRYGISQVTELILRVLDYPIVRNGLLLSIDGREIFMGAACSGFRSLVTMFALASAYTYFVKSDTRKQLLLIPSVIPLALFGNLLRVITLSLITYYAGHEAAEGFFHYFSGGVIFLIMIGGLMGLEYLIDRRRGA